MKKNLKITDFVENTTASRLDLSDVEHGSPLHTLIEALNCTTLMGQKNPKKSVMYYEQLCNHDSGHLCEHRLQYIVDFIKENFIKSSSNAESFDADDFLTEKDIYNHPYITTRNNDNSYEVSELMAEFANKYYKNEDV